MSTTTKTRAAVLVDLNSPLEIMEIDLPALRSGEVLVKVHSTGLCHTQLLEIKGENASGPHNPNLLGHEGSGVVVEVGEAVNKVSAGDHVVLSWIKGAGANVCPEPLTQGNAVINRGPVTTFSEFTVVSENRVTPIHKKMPLRPAALLGCAVPTGIGMTKNTAQVKPHNTVLVIGCGGIGINAIHGSSLAKAVKVIAADINDYKLVAARKFGATHAINSLKQDLKSEVMQITDGNGADIAIDAVGSRATMESAYELSNNIHGKTILCGVPNPPGLKINVDPFPLFYGKRLIGTGGGESNPDVDYQDYANLYASSQLNLDGMITHEYSLSEINEGFDVLRSGDCLRVIITME